MLASEEKVIVNGEELEDVDSFSCQSWRMTKSDEAKLDTFQQKCLRRLLKIYWPMLVSNEEVQRRANTDTISELVKKRRWALIGHVLRMDNSCLLRVALTCGNVEKDYGEEENANGFQFLG